MVYASVSAKLNGKIWVSCMRIMVCEIRVSATKKCVHLVRRSAWNSRTCLSEKGSAGLKDGLNMALRAASDLYLM